MQKSENNRTKIPGPAGPSWVKYAKATKKENNSRQTTIMFYGESHLYAKLRAKELKRKGIGNGNISDFIEWLICKDKAENKETYLLSEKYYLMEKELNQSSNNIT